MRIFQKKQANNWITLLLVLCLVLSTSGCAAIFRGTSQTVTVITDPPDQTITYQGREVSHGETITIQKHFDTPTINAGRNGSQRIVNVTYDPDPLIIGDAVLLFFFIIPGLVALGVDFGTGAWRDFHSTQVVYVTLEETEENVQPEGEELETVKVD